MAGLEDREEALGQALHRAADALAAAVEEVAALHRQYVEVSQADAEGRGVGEKMVDDLRHHRLDMGLYSAGLLIDYARQEAEEAGRRYPAVGASGVLLPPRPPSDDPEQVRDWWAGLTKDDRIHLLTHDTVWVGQADGLPVAVRHEANLRLLDAEIERRSSLAQDPEALADEGTVEEVRDLRGLLKLRSLLADADDPHRHAPEDPPPEGLEKVTTPPRQRYLYLLDAHTYPLKSAVVFGDLEAARHVVLHVPGATTTVDMRLFREARWMSWLRDEAGRLAGDRDRVAVVDWIGYHAPYDIATRRALGDSGMSVIVPGEASDERYARDAAPALHRCALGLRALIGDEVRLVASGHSYGASVVGLACTQEPVFDAVMVAGCPGLFTADLDDLHVPPGTVYAALAPGDIVAFLGIFGGQVVAIPGIRLLSPYARRATYPEGGWTILKPVWGHESYYNPGTATLAGLAAVVVGDEERVRTTTWLGLSRTVEQGEEDAAAGDPEGESAALQATDTLARMAAQARRALREAGPLAPPAARKSSPVARQPR